MYKYEYKFQKIKDLRVYHKGQLTIYLHGLQLYWNRYGVLQRTTEEEVTKYFELH